MELAISALPIFIKSAREPQNSLTIPRRQSRPRRIAVASEHQPGQRDRSTEYSRLARWVAKNLEEASLLRQGSGRDGVVRPSNTMGKARRAGSHHILAGDESMRKATTGMT